VWYVHKNRVTAIKMQQKELYYVQPVETEICLYCNMGVDNCFFLGSGWGRSGPRPGGGGQTKKIVFKSYKTRSQKKKVKKNL
jgi:hypothetical protein